MNEAIGERTGDTNIAKIIYVLYLIGLVWGARPLKRVIQKDVQDSLARLILEGRISDGDRVAVTFDGNDFLFNGASDKKAA